MPHDIDPKSDFAFKLLFGTEEHLDLLLDFLTAVLRPATPIVGLTLVSPIVAARFAEDDQTIVDVMAVDAIGRQYAIEVQVRVRPALRERIAYAAMDAYQAQMTRGGEYDDLRPLIVIWVLDGALFGDAPGWHQRFELRDPDSMARLTDRLVIHVLQLKKWRRPEAWLDAADRWAYFFLHAAGAARLPAEITTPELERAMSVLDRIAEDRELYEAYRRRRAIFDKKVTDWEIREAQKEAAAAKAELASAIAARDGVLAENDVILAEKDVILAEKDVILAEKDVILAEKDVILAEKDVILAEKDVILAEKGIALAEAARLRAEAEHLRARLLAAGLDPDAP